MARTDANPPMPEFRDDYALVEVDADYLAKAVKPKQFLHIDQAECIMCEGCVDICPWKCIHMVSPDAIDEAVNTEQPGEDPATTSCSSSTKTSAPGARSASTAARPASSSSARSAPPTRDGDPHARDQQSRLRLRHAVLGALVAKTVDDKPGIGAKISRGEQEDGLHGPGLAGVELDLPARARSSGRATPTAPGTAPT